MDISTNINIGGTPISYAKKPSLTTTEKAAVSEAGIDSKANNTGSSALNLDLEMLINQHWLATLGIEYNIGETTEKINNSGWGGSNGYKAILTTGTESAFSSKIGAGYNQFLNFRRTLSAKAIVEGYLPNATTSTLTLKKGYYATSAADATIKNWETVIDKSEKLYKFNLLGRLDWQNPYGTGVSIQAGASLFTGKNRQISPFMRATVLWNIKNWNF